MAESPSPSQERTIEWPTTSKWILNPFQWTWFTWHMAVRTGESLVHTHYLRVRARGPLVKTDLIYVKEVPE